MMSEIEEFTGILAKPEFKDDVGLALRKYYEGAIGLGGRLREQGTSIEAIPMLMYKTHVTALIDGVQKSVTISDFKHVIAEVTSSEDDKIPPMALPYGCFMFNRAGENLRLNCYYRGTVEEIKYDNREGRITKFKIPLPNIILSFILKRAGNLWQVMSCTYFCTQRSVTQLPDDIFITKADHSIGVHRMPFPNMYGDNRMCYGGNTMPVRFTNNLRGLDYYFQVLTQAPFNADLGVSGVSLTTSAKSWLEHLQGKTEFPYDLLTKSNG